MSKLARLLLFGFLLMPALARAEAPPHATKTLANGLQVIVVENHAQPLLTIELAVRTGSMSEPPEYNGLSHLYEHMFFKGNQVISDQSQWLRKARSLGVQSNATTNTEFVNYYFTTTTDHFAGAMEFMRDAIVSPKFDPVELEKERVVVTGEMDRAESNPYYFLWHETQKRLFYRYPSRKDPLGNRQTVLKTTVEQLKTIQERYYVPNNSALLVTGDVKAGEVFKMSEVLYANWERAEDPLVKFPPVQHPPLPSSSVVLVQQPVQTVNGSFNWHGPSVKGAEIPATYAADLFSYSQAEPSSKMQQALVDSGACVSVGLSWLTQANVGPITLSFEAAPDKVDRCVLAILAELPKLKEAGYVSDEELANAAFRAEIDAMLAREKPSQLTHTLTFWWSSAGLDYYLGYVDNLKKVTRSQIASYFDTYVLGKPFVFSVMVSPNLAKAGLNQAHFEKLVGAKPWSAQNASVPAGTSKGGVR
jgi:zinc protease